MANEIIHQLESSLKSTKKDEETVLALNNSALEYSFSDKTKELGQNALNLARSIGYEYGIATSCLTLSKHNRNKNNFTLAYTYALQAHNIFCKNEDKKRQIESITELIMLTRETGDMDEHLRLSLELVNTAVSIDNKEAEGKAYNQLANFYDAMDDKERAVENYERSIAILENFEDTAFLSKVSANLGETLGQLGQYKRGLELVRQSLELDRSNNDSRGVGINYGLLARIYLAMKSYDKALLNLKQQLQYAEDLDNNKLRVRALMYIGQIYLKQGKFDEAFVALQSCISIAEKHKSYSELRRAYQYIVDVYKAKGNYQQALIYYELFFELNQTIYNKQADLRRQFLTIQHETHQTQIELEYQKQRAEVAEQHAEKDKQFYLQLVEMKKQFIDSFTHDLKNPLASIIMATEILKRKIGNETTKHYFDRIVKQSLHMNHLIGEMLELAKLETKYAIKRELLPLDELITTVLSDYHTISNDKNIRLIVDSASELSTLLIHYDMNNMRRALGNLVSNAIKYSPSDKSVKIHIEAIEGTVKIEIIDYGYGIPKSDLPNIFTPFYRVGNKETEQIEGTGLGLCIVKTIIEQHTGSVTVESEVGKGTTFKIILPQ